MVKARRMAGAGPRAGLLKGRLEELLGVLPAEARDALHGMWRREMVAEGRVLAEEGAVPARVGFLVSGMLGMVKRLPDGRRHIIGLLVPGDMYGFPPEGRPGYRLEALAASQVMSCGRAGFEALLAGAPQAEQRFIANMLDELDAAREWMLLLGGQKVTQRLAGLLLILARGASRGSGGALNLRLALRRAELAQYLGTRPETLSRAFRDLESRGLVRRNDPYDLDILDLAGLAGACGQDIALARRGRGTEEAGASSGRRMPDHP
ncbi:Crp/Fnr family transcriptional regulator [Oceanicella sp. SM1341]|uniref:Crp/Fnr family transcriptional regulator n=1 Tax=Oceanicella sp. SM1341 TaxID=1548889 RepID=UPI0018E53EFD|nr:Crp/Fnr family transcriptional regulator [Oceanicella sp. SM1341]